MSEPPRRDDQPPPQVMVNAHTKDQSNAQIQGSGVMTNYNNIYYGGSKGGREIVLVLAHEEESHIEAGPNRPAIIKLEVSNWGRCPRTLKLRVSDSLNSVCYFNKRRVGVRPDIQEDVWIQIQCSPIEPMAGRRSIQVVAEDESTHEVWESDKREIRILPNPALCLAQDVVKRVVVRNRTTNRYDVTLLLRNTGNTCLTPTLSAPDDATHVNVTFPVATLNLEPGSNVNREVQVQIAFADQSLRSLRQFIEISAADVRYNNISENLRLEIQKKGRISDVLAAIGQQLHRLSGWCTSLVRVRRAVLLITGLAGLLLGGLLGSLFTAYVATDIVAAQSKCPKIDSCLPNNSLGGALPTSQHPSSPTPGEQLAAYYADDAEEVARVPDGYWVPQLAANKPGLDKKGTNWDEVSILQDHLDRRNRYGITAALLKSSDFDTYESKHHWVTVVPSLANATPKPVLDWCNSKQIDVDHCFARRLSKTSEYPNDNSKYRG